VKESSKLEQQLILGKIVEFKMPKEFDLNNSYDIKEYIYTEAFDKGYIHVLLDFSGTEYRQYWSWYYCCTAQAIFNEGGVHSVCEF